MKQVCFFAFFLLLLCSCSKTENNDVLIAGDEEVSVGRQHNECLKLIQTKLFNQETKALNPLTQKQLRAIVSETTIDFVSAEYELEPDGVAYLNAVVDKSFDKKVDVDSLFSSINADISSFLAELDGILGDNDENIVSLKSRICDVRRRAKSKLSESDYQTIEVSASVAENTLEYWYQNAANWGQNTTKASFSWKSLGKADLRGAISTATGELAACCLGCGPVGWKAWVAITLGGAVVSSADNAICQIWGD